MDLSGQKKTAIAKLLIKGAAIDNVAARLHLEKLFGADEFAPAGLPSEAIFCIRKLSDPRPQTLRLDHADWRFAENWRRAVSREVENYYRRAFRPLRESVPAQAESVIFADKTELLACLASDWMREKLRENWWWRGIFPNLETAQTVAQIWREAAEFAPQSFQILAKRGEIIGFVQKLQSPEVKDLLKQIIKNFGLQKIEAVLFEPPVNQPEFVSEILLKGGKKVVSLNENTIFAKPSEAFFDDLIPELKNETLDFERQSLLIVGLLLGRSSKIVRSNGFADKLKLRRIKIELYRASEIKKYEQKIESRTTFEEITQTPENALQKLPEKKKIQPNQSKKVKKETRFFDEITGGEIEKKSQNTEIESSNLLKTAAQNITRIIKTTEPAKIKIDFENAETQLKNEKVEPKTNEKSNPKIERRKKKTGIENYSEETEPANVFTFQTNFGGVFYLLNLALFLQLYRDFTEPSTAEIDLNIWDFVALSSLEFLGKQIKKDTVWDFLKSIAERKNDHDFGCEFDQTQDWRVPTDWLKTFLKDQKWFYLIQDKRLVIRHSEGFNVIDIRQQNDWENQLANEAEVYREYFSELVEVEKSRQMQSKKWLQNLTEFMQKRLFQALNLQSTKELNAVLFEQTASFSISATHLEITFSLADLPLEIRFAGIDRDPGWIPAAGKFVYFHFV